MSETVELVKGTIEKITERIDVIAAKLGVAAGKIWNFSVIAKTIEAKKTFAKGAAGLLIVFVLFGWTTHIAFMKLPHDIRPREVTAADIEANYAHIVSSIPLQVTSVGQEDRGISDDGYFLIWTGILAVIAGLIIATICVCAMINGFAGVKTAEYDAFTDLMRYLRD